MVCERRRPPGRARARRLAFLLAGIALASAGFAPDAAAVCNVTAAGSVNCVSATTTTNTTNLNGATAASSDRIQEFNNGANIIATIPAGVTVGGFGLNLLLSNAGGNNTMAVFHNGLITTSQAVAALQLNGNGGAINYIGNGSIANTGSGSGLVVTNTGAGTAIVVATGGSIVGGTSGLDITTGTGAVLVNGANLIQASNGTAVRAISSGGSISVSGIDEISGVTGISSVSGGGGISILNNGNITGTARGINASSGGGGLSITGNGNITGATNTGITASSGGGGLSIANNGNITGNLDGINVSSFGGGLSITGNGNITGTLAAGIFAISSGGGLTISGNGNITGGIDGIAAGSDGGGLSIVTGGTVTGNTGTGITTFSGGGSQFLTLNHNVTGATHGVNLTSTATINLNNQAILTGATNAILLSSNIFNIQNLGGGTINGDVNATAAVPTFSGMINAGTWNTGTGNSTIDAALVNSGTLNAQNGVAQQTINIANAYFNSGALRIDLGDRLIIGSTANLTGGSLNVALAPNSPLAHSNVVLTSAGLGGTTFATTTLNMPNVTATVVYTPTDVLVNILAAQLGNGANLNQNQTNVATSINNFFNAGNNLPAGFGALFGLTGAPLGNALTQVSGEVATGIQPAANMSMGLFLNAMLDPFVAGRGGANGIGAPMGYAPQTPSRVEVAAREAFAADMPVKARPAPLFEQRWSVWSATYGGYNHTDGDPVVGSNNLNARAYGIASGFDYRVSRDTVIGVAGATGQTRWGVANLGNGDSDTGQIGAYGSTRWNNMYLSAAVAFAWHQVETHRTVTVAGVDRLDAKFNATSVGGRVEGGYRYGGAQYGLTPYAAVQVQSLHTPNYGESASIGSNQFALTFASQTTTDTRSELGFWADTRFLFANGIQTTLRGRAAWVHDFNPGSRINPAFQTLPGASFTIDGAAAPRDATLTSAVAEFKLPTGITLIGKADGEFSGRSTTVAGTGTIKYAW